MFLAAYAAGQGTQAELAEVFGVRSGWAEKVCRQQRHGPVSRVDAAGKACLLTALQEQDQGNAHIVVRSFAVRCILRLKD